MDFFAQNKYTGWVELFPQNFDNLLYSSSQKFSLGSEECWTIKLSQQVTAQSNVYLKKSTKSFERRMKKKKNSQKKHSKVYTLPSLIVVGVY